MSDRASGEPYSRPSGWLVLKAMLVPTLAVLTVAACAPVPIGDGDRRIVVRNLTTQVILPTWDELVARSEKMTVAAERLAEMPSEENLGAAQQAWRSVRVPWKEAEAFAFGPAMDLRLGVAIDQSPVDTEKVDLELEGTVKLNASYIETLGANRKGFHALEHLLFRSADDAAVLESLTADALASRRRDLVFALSLNLERKAGELRDAWDPRGGNYAQQFVEPGSAGSSYPTIQSVVDTLVNECVFLCELVANNKLGKPMGMASGGEPRPELEESGPSDNSVADIIGNLRSIRNVYLGTRTGKDSAGVGRLVAAQSSATDRAMRDAVEHAVAAVTAIERPYVSALAEQHPSVEAAYQAVKSLKRLLATEVVAVLGATLKFNDNDGD